MKTDRRCDKLLLDAVTSAGLDTVQGAFAHTGGRDLAKDGLDRRRRTRLILRDAEGREHELYLKRYGSHRPADRLRRLVTCASSSSPARSEFENIRAVQAVGIPTMKGVIFGEEGGRLWPRRSYIIVTAVPGDAMERCLERFLTANPDRAVEEITTKLAKIVSALHAAGYVHRDLYSSHVFLDAVPDEAELYLIDLARMFRPRWRRMRWRVKDLAQLKYSMPAAWVDRWWDFFLDVYLGPKLCARAARYNRAVDRKVRSVLRRNRRKQARSAGGTNIQ